MFDLEVHVKALHAQSTHGAQRALAAKQTKQ